jgi:2-polyprenyl-3-methyl-5-hydroxy-6-metoxy-1,4-benzoquinol methylase
MRKFNVALTIGFQGEEKNFSMWVNGARQNILFLYLNLKRSKLIENIYIVNCGGGKIKDYTISSEIKMEDFNIVEWDVVKDNIDLLIEIGMQVGDDKVKYLRDRGAKVVAYRVGNSYVLGMESTLYKRQKGPIFLETNKFDECWTNEQHMNTNKYFFEALYRCPVKVVPHVWHPILIDKTVEKFKDIEFIYKNLNKNKRISIFEPNINVVKTSIYPMLICEKFYNRNPKYLEKIMITNTVHLNTDRQFVNFAHSLNITKNKIASFEARYMTPYILGKYTDIVISHQWENALNYLYYDVFYLKYPLVHNSQFLKEYGYYYDGFNVEEGSKALEKAVFEHDNNIESYNKMCEKVIWEHHSDNDEIVEFHNKLILNLFKEVNFTQEREKILLDKVHNELFYDTTITKLNYKKILSEIKVKITKNKKILDVGCGNGYNTNQYSLESKNDIDGVDISYKRIEYAKQLAEELNTKCNFYNQDIHEYIDKCEKKYDYIFLFDVLKYIENPYGLLIKLKTLLNKNGVIIGDVTVKLKDYEVINFFCDVNHVDNLLKPTEIYELEDQENYYLCKWF